MGKKAEILYEPMPIGRIGVRKKDDEIVIAKDFSTFAFMLEEYISYGAVNIVLPSSSPESLIISQMPELLQKRIKLINDDSENEIVNRLLFTLRKEFSVGINEQNGFLKFDKSTPTEAIHSLTVIHNEVKKLAIGFNHDVQINVNTEQFLKNLYSVRKLSTNQSTRIILAQLEATVKQYSDLKLDAIIPPRDSTPIELINIFDKLINDPLYAQYSTSVAKLSGPIDPKSLLTELRSQIRSIGSKKYIESGWDYVTKIIKLFTGIPIPDSKAIETLITDRNFPVLVNMDSAKQRVFQTWWATQSQSAPLSRNGISLADDQIDWMPVSQSVDVSGQDGTLFSIGKTKDVLKILMDFQALDKNEK